MLLGSKETVNAADFFEYDMKAVTHVGANRNPVIVTTTKRIKNDEARFISVHVDRFTLSSPTKGIHRE
jgi:hypothetical protein